MRGRFLEMVKEWITTPTPPAPTRDDLPVVPSRIAAPTTSAGEVRITWIGHSTHLIQVPGLNLLTDPIWSGSAWPIPSVGSRRFAPASPPLDGLPPLQAVLLSHDHYDHLDRETVVELRVRYGDELRWYVPLGFRGWFERLGVRSIVEMDWWEEAPVPGTGYRIVALPSRHWCRRTPWDTNRRLWASWALVGREATTSGNGREPVGAPATETGREIRIYFGGDSAYASFFSDIGGELGPFDASILPIGAYEPRWFMKVSHMNPEESVQVYEDLGGGGVFLPSHWGTFRLTLEDPLEPPERLRRAWAERGLDPELLHVTSHGETVTLSVPRRRRVRRRPEAAG